MRKLRRYVLTAMIAIGIVSWMIDVFGRTMHPSPAHHVSVPVERTWDGYVMVIKRSDPAAVVGW